LQRAFYWREGKNWVAGATEEVAERVMLVSVQAGQTRSRPEKRLPREEVAERRGTSAKRWLSEEVAHQRISSLIHSFIHALVL